MTPYYTKAYVDTRVRTSDRMELVIALYEGAMASINQAIEAIEAGDEARRMASIEKASEIIMALSEALDFTQEGGVAGKLFALYHYMLRQLLEANRNVDSEPLQTVRGTLAILLDGWLQAANSDEAVGLRRHEAKEREATGRNSTRPNGHAAFVLTA